VEGFGTHKKGVRGAQEKTRRRTMLKARNGPSADDFKARDVSSYPETLEH